MTPASSRGPRKVRSDRGRRKADATNDERRPTLRDLPGIGPAIERRLAKAGLTSVVDLANADETELVEQLRGASGVTPGKVHDWIAAARDVTSAATVTTVDEAPDTRDSTETPERQESFVLTLSIDGAGNVQHSTIRHTRTGLEGTKHGWSPEHLRSFIADHARLASANEMTPTGSDAGQPRPDREPLRLSLDAGHLIGGGKHGPARVTVRPPAFPKDATAYDYDLVVTARQLGHRRWRPLGRVQGRATTGEEIAAEFDGDLLPPVVHRITLAGHVYAVAGKPSSWSAEESGGTATA